MSKLALYNVISLTAYFVAAFFIGKALNVNIEVKPLFFGIFASWLILMIGVQMVHLKFKKGQFLNRFLMTTVFQMLAFLSLAVYLIYSKFDNPKPLLLTLVVVHMLALFIQTIFFLRLGKTTT